jgi:hypothetical protein
MSTNTDVKTTPAYKEDYSPRMKALCDLAIEIIQDVDKNAKKPHWGVDVTPSEQAVWEAIDSWEATRRLRSGTWRALGRLFGELHTHALYLGAFQDGMGSMMPPGWEPGD